MPREITTHKVNGVNDGIDIVALDEPGVGGAHHLYQLTLGMGVQEIHFQDGPLAAGINGVTHEALTAIIIDRLEAFQRGPFCSEDVEMALGHYRLAMVALKRRTEKRLARGVEGTHAV